MTELLVGNQLAALSLDASLSPATEHSVRSRATTSGPPIANPSVE